MLIILQLMPSNKQESSVTASTSVDLVIVKLKKNTRRVQNQTSLGKGQLSLT